MRKQLSIFFLNQVYEYKNSSKARKIKNTTENYNTIQEQNIESEDQWL
jgi:hypothetical protein